MGVTKPQLFRMLFVLAVVGAGAGFMARPTAAVRSCNGPPGAGQVCCNEDSECSVSQWDSCNGAFDSYCIWEGTWPLCSTDEECPI